MSDETTAPKWTYDHEHASIRDASGRLLADVYEGNEDCGDIGKLMASAPDLARALRDHVNACSECSGVGWHSWSDEPNHECGKCHDDRALLATLPVLDGEQEK